MVRFSLKLSSCFWGKVIIGGIFVESLSIDPFGLFKDETNVTGSYASSKSEFPNIMDVLRRVKFDVEGIIPMWQL